MTPHLKETGPQMAGIFNGFDIIGCHDACGATDIDCHMRCDDQAATAQQDPSACSRDNSKDATCTSSKCGGKAATSTCSITANCVPNKEHCFDGRCFANEPGSPCAIDADCGTLYDHCTNGCCFDGSFGNPCDINANCESSACDQVTKTCE